MDQKTKAPLAAVSTHFAPAPFDGKRFHNLSGQESKGALSALRWMATRQRTAWPKTIAPVVGAKPPPRVDDGTVRATLVSHATVLLQFGGLNILTDPVLSDRIGPTSFIGIKRVSPPAIAFDDLPRIDVVLLSHNHYDHLDRPSLAALHKRDRPRVVTGLKVGAKVPGDRVIELDWWQTHGLDDRVRATYVPSEHFSGRGPFDRDTSLWGGFVLETDIGTLYFAGDTAAGTHFEAIRERFGPMTLSLIPIGAYAPRWFMAPVHIDPAEALAASLTLESQVSLAIHYGTFALADEGIDTPEQDLKAALAARPADVRGMDFRVTPFGQPLIVRRNKGG